MVDLIFLVRYRQTQAAPGYFLDQGWRVSAKNFVVLSDDYLCNHNGISLKQSGRCEIDLYWRVLLECLDITDDDGFWHTVSADHRIRGANENLE